MQSKRGTVLVVTLMVVTVLFMIGASFILRAVNEWYTAQREKRIAESFTVAEGGAAEAIDKIDDLINTYMLNTINMTNPQTVGNKAKQYVNSHDALGFLVLYVKNGSTALLTRSGSQATYSEPSTAMGTGTFTYNITITQKSNPITVATDTWDFSYIYQIRAQGRSGGMLSQLSLLGDFTVRVQRDNFARYALFTDHHGLPSGTTVWFTDKTQFFGPLHTNERYSFYKDPTFDGTVTQHLTTAQFYNQGDSFTADADSNPPDDVPVFNSTYTRGVSEIVLESSVQKSDLYTQACGGSCPSSNGVYVANNGSTVTGGIYVNGSSSIVLEKDSSGNAKYTVTQGSTTKFITVDITNNQTKVQTQGGSTVTYTGLPDGVDDVGTIIYVNGSVSSLKGTVQKDTELTVSAADDIVVTDNLVYEEYTPASGTPGTSDYVPPNAVDKTNLLGLVAWGGDVRIADTAPANINLHGVVMARNGVFQADDYDTRAPAGDVTLLGGVITQFYGAFGTFNGTTGAQVSGYGRNFVYDDRTALGKAPPYFPSMKTFIAFTNDITDKVAYREGNF